MTRPLSVVMVSAGFHPTVGGAEKQALELSKTLKSRGIGVEVLTRRLAGLRPSEEIEGVAVRRLPAWGSGWINSLVFMAAVFMRLVLDARRYEAVHAHLAASPALAAVLAARLCGKRVVIKLGGGRGIGEIAVSSRTWSGRLKLALLNLLKPQCVSVTRDLALELGEHGLSGLSVRVIPNGVDVERYHPLSPEEKTRARERLGWPPGLCFLYMGRFSPEKRLDWFLDAWSEAVGSAQAIAVLMGDGPEKARVAVAAERCSGRVRLLPFTGDAAAAYAAADVFFLPSTSEGLSNALLEAMASGLGVIASRVGGSAEVLEDGKTALLFDVDDRQALKDAVASVIARPERLAVLGAAARAKAVESFSLASVAQHYEALYRG